MYVNVNSLSLIKLAISVNIFSSKIGTDWQETTATSNFIFKISYDVLCQAGGMQQTSENVAMVVTTIEGEVLPPEEQKGKAKARAGILMLCYAMHYH